MRVGQRVGEPAPRAALPDVATESSEPGAVETTSGVDCWTALGAVCVDPGVSVFFEVLVGELGLAALDVGTCAFGVRVGEVLVDGALVDGVLVGEVLVGEVLVD